MKRGMLFAAVTAMIWMNIVSTAMASDSGSLIFQSGFEPDSHVVSTGRSDDIVGVDGSVAPPNDWVKNLDEFPGVGEFNLQYQGGDDTMRHARIIPEPGNPTNHVLQFWLNEANVEGIKGRIQANLYGASRGMREFYQSERVFLSEDFNTMRRYPGSIHWLTIAEFWNNIGWGTNVSHAFRVTLGIGKPSEGEGPLRFIIDGQDFLPVPKHPYTTLWAETNEEVEVPVGKWFTLEYYYKEGNAETGRFYMTIQPDGGPRQVVFDVTNFTHNSHDPDPDGVTDFNPLKLYTSKELIEYMRSQGKTLEIYWDDLKLWENRQP